MDYSFDIAALWGYRTVFARSILVTVELSLLSIALGTLLGIVIGSVRHYGRDRLLGYPFWGLATAYLYVFLALPALVLLVWLYYCLPLFGIQIDSFWTAVIALGVNLSPFAAEIFRSGLSNIPAGELDAARAMGYTRMQIVLLFMIPQVFRNSVPPLMGQYYTTIKMSSLASVIGVFEIINTAQEVINDTYKTLEVYTVVALCYALVVVPFAIIAKRYEDRALIQRI